ncbi:ribonuclease HII [Nitratireductor sp. CAU 1489]|uniref:Ribonuclease HII n=1 Tax=Nitratireductor arenosus TaxID=2682096 RepID=A0A844QL51_9HYPH|nr:ribonuclease HII [Nitratireductor arenosus]MVA98743.1 ribonuclease HII [Nitratireductor arenosus]
MARPPDSPLLFDPADGPDFSHEERAMRRGFFFVCGVDEAGRGPLAGPVVAAAVILDPDAIPAGLDDSKRLSAATRSVLYKDILDRARAVGVASLSAQAIDRSNVLRASLEAMRRAVASLSIVPGFALIDGRDVPPALACPAEALVKGDRRAQSIAAASIVAKVMRDRMMAACGRRHTEYGFDRHMGYGTQIHREAIARGGAIARIHRLSFAPLRAAADTTTEA